MRSFGQVVKNQRKSMEMSQLELAEKLGVSVQTVSRWECDSAMPDIVQIVPLAKILGTTTDMLLGMEASENDDIDAFNAEMEEFWDKTSFNNPREGERYEDKIFETYKKCRELYKRYPTNFELALRCSSFGVEALEMVHKYHRLTLDEKDEKAVKVECERMLRSVINYDAKLGEKISAKKLLINLYCCTNEWEKAERELDDLDEREALNAKLIVAHARDEQEDREDTIVFAKEMLENSAWDLYNALYTLGRAYSIFGKPKRPEATKVWEKTLEIFSSLGDASDKFITTRVELTINMLLAKEYIRESDVDRCLDYTEKVVEKCIEFFNLVKEPCVKKDTENVFLSPSEPPAERENDLADVLEKCKRDLMWWIVACWEECGSDDNPVTRTDRYKALMDKYEKEMIIE